MENMIDFFNEISKLKELNRKGWVDRNINPCETVGSHTFGVLFLVWLFSNEKCINVEKALKMALIHDLLECITGDIIPGQYEKNERDVIEKKALKKMRNVIPHNIKNEILNLFNEYNSGKTIESKIIRSCDKIDSVLQAIYYAKTDRVDISTVIDFQRSAKRFDLDLLPDTVISTIDSEIEKMLLCR
jgi:putative hydrolase of HD superfamily